jgi:hypothetical protein
MKILEARTRSAWRHCCLIYHAQALPIRLRAECEIARRLWSVAIARTSGPAHVCTSARANARSILALTYKFPLGNWALVIGFVCSSTSPSQWTDVDLQAGPCRQLLSACATAKIPPFLRHQSPMLHVEGLLHCVGYRWAEDVTGRLILLS